MYTSKREDPVEVRRGSDPNVSSRTRSPEQPSPSRPAPAALIDSVPTLNLPKGGGAIRGIGEKLSVNPATGTAAFSLPLPFSPGRGGAAPDLQLSYDSGAGAGICGWGWHLSLPAISYRTDKGLPTYLEDAAHPPRFVLAGDEDLVPLLTNGTPVTIPDPNFLIRLYAPRLEGRFARIERWVHNTTGESHWRVKSADNITTLFGSTAETRISDPQEPSRIFIWLAAETFDDKGHRVVFEYKQEDREGVDPAAAHEANQRGSVNPQRHLKRILYGNVAPKGRAGDDRFLFEFLLDYGEHTQNPPARAEAAKWKCRTDPISTYRAGFELRTYRLCERVVMFHRFPNGADADARPVRALAFDYQRDAVASLLTGARTVGYAQLSNGQWISEEAPAATFDYQRAPETLGPQLTLDPGDAEELPAGFAEASVQWIDIDGDGLAGALLARDDAWAFKPNLSPLHLAADGVPIARLGRLRTLASAPSGAGVQSRGRFADVEGDGLPDLVHLDGAAPGFSGREHDGTWLPRRPFRALPNLDWSDPDLHFLDLTGDGLLDIVIGEDDRIQWCRALGRDGYGDLQTSRIATDDEKGPSLVRRDGDSAIFLADMSGDGLTDIVRVRAREVAYWPNLGYGRFGAKVALSNAPDLGAFGDFDPALVRLADTDGSGTTDVVYLGERGWSVYVNCAGNSLAEPRVWTTAPPVDELATVDAFDLLGNGTACLVWSTKRPVGTGRQIQYLPLAGGVKPYLLNRVRNGLGLETRIDYAPSTVFQLRDRMAGRPWATRLPFPVHVVERIEIHERISGHRFVSHYAYHHGAYDGREREFRGFGFVEQWDSEGWSGTIRAPAPNEREASQVPPVRTRRWYHTGMPSPDADMSRLYERDFFGGTGSPNATAAERALLARTRLADIETAPGLAARDHQDICRAAKGLLLREEVYADDGSSRARVPYAISCAGYEAQVRQTGSATQPAIVFVHPRETLQVHLERDIAAPRVRQTFVLKVGRFGEVLERAELAHAGPAPAVAGPGGAAIAQAYGFVDEIEVTTHVDEPHTWRTPLTAETRRFALAGAALSAPWPMSRTTMRQLIAAATPLTYIDAIDPTAAPCGKRPLSRSRTLYRRDDYSGPLAFRQLDAKALPYETYTLAFTSALLTQQFGARIPAGAALGEAGYVDLEGDGSLWVPSGRAYFVRTKDHPEEASAPAQRTARATAERDEAAAHFHLPRAFRDIYGAHAFIDYDALDLFPAAVEDRAGNITAATYDTRTLQPRQIVDANGSRSFTAYDVHGRVASAAIAGKAGTAEGDTEPAPDALLQPVDVDVLIPSISNPASQQTTAAQLLGSATTRVLTDARRFSRSGKPTAVVTLTRETHVSDLAPGATSRIAIALAYADGTGRIVQSKVLTEPGPVTAGGAAVPVRWITSGWTIFDNKGNPVRTFEPFHSDSPDYEPNRAAGVSSIIFRDPLSRVIGALHPDGSIEKTRFSAWSQQVWDANDTVLVLNHQVDPDLGPHIARLEQADQRTPWHAQRSGGAKGPDAQAAAAAAAAHADTPSELFADPLGRPLITVENGAAAGVLVTTVLLDVDGREREVIDPEGRVVARYEHDLLGRRTVHASMEAGIRRMFAAADGLGLYAWDDRGHVGRQWYDGARRPTDTEVTDATGTHVRHRVVYGEPLGSATNHRGRVHQLYDGAGLVTTLAYDFKGAPTGVQRQFAKEHRGQPDWSANPALTLDAETFTARTRYDALGRPIQSTAPVSSRAGAPVSVVQCLYDESGKLDVVDLWLDQAQAPAALLATGTATRRVVTGIDHDALGRRTAIRYGNGTETTFTFDPESMRLTRVRTVRGGGLANDAQNLAYTHDPVGNITRIVDAAQQTIYFAGQVVRPSNSYGYDALYRLVTAEGREHRGQSAQLWPNWHDGERRGDHPENAAAMRTYTQQYSYDLAGNILKIQHMASGGNWTRDFSYLEASLLEPGTRKSNRLTRSVVGNDTETFIYDAHGNVTKMNHLSAMTWDHADRFASADLGGGGRVDYQYGATGERIRKVVERRGASGAVTGYEERLYLGGFEIFRVKDQNGALTRERETLFVADGSKTILHVESRTQGSAAADPAPARLFRYQFDNHLGSASLELDDTGAVISYEEYHPYGSTSVQTVRSRTETPKRYRYTGKERDEESGFTYHSARYYAPWVGRWISCDPAGLADGTVLYAHAGGNPIRFKDGTGRMSKEAQAAYEKERHACDRMSGDQIAAVYQKPEDVPKELGPTKQSVNSALQQRRRFMQGEAKRVQDQKDAAQNTIVTKEEKFEAAKKGAQNWFVGKAGVGLGYVIGGPILHPLGTVVADYFLEPLRAPEPPQYPVGLRQVELKENYGAAQTTLTVTEIGVTTVAPMIGESAFALRTPAPVLTIEPPLATPPPVGTPPHVVTTTNTQLQRLENAANMQTRWVAGDETLAEGYQNIQGSQQTWPGFRGALVREANKVSPGAIPPNTPIHHWSYPRTQYPQGVQNPENLFIADQPGSHQAIHGAFGGYNSMGQGGTWVGIPGAEGELRDMFLFWSTNKVPIVW